MADIRLSPNACAHHAGGTPKKRELIDDLIDALVWMRRQMRKPKRQSNRSR
jgi:hypothetical protein